MMPNDVNKNTLFSMATIHSGAIWRIPVSKTSSTEISSDKIKLIKLMIITVLYFVILCSSYKFHVCACSAQHY